MSSMTKFNLIAIFNRKIFEVDQLVIEDVDYSNFVWEGHQKMKA